MWVLNGGISVLAHHLLGAWIATSPFRRVKTLPHDHSQRP